MQTELLLCNSESKLKSRSIDLRLSVISLLLFAVSFPLFFSAVTTYAAGISALGYKEADAEVIKISEVFDAFSVRKQACLSFQSRGVEQKALVPVPSGRFMKRGEHTVLFFDEKNPLRATLTREIDYDPIVVNGSFGLFGLSLSLFILSRAFPKKVSAPEKAAGTAEDSV